MRNDHQDQGVSNDLEKKTTMSETTPTDHPADETAVRDLYHQLMDGWNRGSGDAFAVVFAEDGDLVAFDGTHFEGREEIAPFHRGEGSSLRQRSGGAFIAPLWPNRESERKEILRHESTKKH